MVGPRDSGLQPEPGLALGAGDVDVQSRLPPREEEGPVTLVPEPGRDHGRCSVDSSEENSMAGVVPAGSAAQGLGPGAGGSLGAGAGLSPWP